MTTVRIDDPALLPDLLQDLGESLAVVAERVGDDAAELSIVGSYNADAMRLVLYLRIRAWEAAQHARGVPVHVELE